MHWGILNQFFARKFHNHDQYATHELLSGTVQANNQYLSTFDHHITATYSNAASTIFPAGTKIPLVKDWSVNGDYWDGFNYRFVVPFDCVVFAHGSVQCAQNYMERVELRLNGAIDKWVFLTGVFQIQVSALIYLTTGDYLELWAKTTSNAALNDSPLVTFLHIHEIARL